VERKLGEKIQTPQRKAPAESFKPGSFLLRGSFAYRRTAVQPDQEFKIEFKRNTQSRFPFWMLHT